MTMQELARQENLAVRNSWRAGAFDQREIEAEIMARIPESWYGPARKKYRVRKNPRLGSKKVEAWKAWKPSGSLTAVPR